MDEGLLQIDDAKERNNLEKFANLTYLFDFWLQAIEQGKTVASFFKDRQYVKIGIYGMGILGRHLKTQLEGNGNEISYIIDKDTIYYGDMTYDLHANMDKLQTADIIVVTPIMEYKEIKEKLKKYISVKIVSIEEVILSI